jgi:hemolysin III
LVAGGVLYTVGAVLYSIKAIPFNHAIFHAFVVTASFCHFIAIYAYIIRL